MGNKNQTVQSPYAVPLDGQTSTPGETPIYRHPLPSRDAQRPTIEGQTMHDSYRRRFQFSPDRQAFGWRQVDPATGNATNEVAWMTNRQFQSNAEAFGSFLIQHNLTPEVREYRDLSLRFLGFYAKQTINYFIADVACGMYGITVVPVYDTLGEEATAFAFRQTGMITCLVDCKHVPGLLQARQKDPSYKALRTLIVIDPENWKGDRPIGSEQDGVTLLSFEAIRQKGSEQVLPWAHVTPNSIYAFSYTSGTTGEPKAAMLSHHNFMSIWPGVDLVLDCSAQDVHLSYLPMAHLIERALFNYCLRSDVTICLSCGDILKLKDDLAIFRPTIFFSVPRLYNRFYEAIMGGVREKGCVAQTLFQNALNTKLENLKRDARTTHWLWDRIVFKKTREVLGGRVRIMAVGSAPISADVLDALKVIFCCPIIEVYGQTEGTGLGFHTHLEDGLSGHVGGPSLFNEFKLVDVPEMNYTSNDVDAEGRPNPRGEIWSRGPAIIQGYYKQDQQNEETFAPGGWLRSGDVGMLVGPQRRLRIIDRKKNIFKLSQGEYIAPEKLESVYKSAHPSVANIFVYGDSLKNHLVGILNVEPEPLLKFAAENGIPGSDAQTVANDPRTAQAYLRLFDAQAKEKKLNSLEKVKALKIETRPFQSLGLLTEALKTKRHAVRQYFHEDLERLYAHSSA